MQSFRPDFIQGYQSFLLRITPFAEFLQAIVSYTIQLLLLVRASFNGARHKVIECRASDHTSFKGVSLFLLGISPFAEFLQAIVSYTIQSLLLVLASFTGARHKCTSLATVPDINVTEVLIAILCLYIDAFTLVPDMN